MPKKVVFHNASVNSLVIGAGAENGKFTLKSDGLKVEYALSTKIQVTNVVTETLQYCNIFLKKCKDGRWEVKQEGKQDRFLTPPCQGTFDEEEWIVAKDP